MSSEFGKILKVSVFGQSHGKAIGVNIDGLPAGESIDLEELQRFLDRRRPGKSPLSTARKEGDVPEILSGLLEGKTCGAPLCAIIRNSDQHSKDYAELADKPRPGHADYTAWVKWKGHADMRGGGHFSGRLTAPLCIAGGIAKQILARRGIYVGAHLYSVGNYLDAPLPDCPAPELFEAVAAKPFPVLNDKNGDLMQKLIERARQELDSVGGVVECAAIGVPAGLGDPMFDGIENRLAAALFGIPAVKGVEFGEGFTAPCLHEYALRWRTAGLSPPPTTPAASWAASPPGCLSCFGRRSSPHRPLDRYKKPSACPRKKTRTCKSTAATTPASPTGPSRWWRR